jgi:U2-associated protein SR140
VVAGGERERDMQLSDLERERLEDMLRQLRVERSSIQAAMVFALDHASCASEISDCLVASLTLAETPLHLKIARLYLASDVLHNSTVPVRNASRYRQLLQAELPAVFQSFREALLSAEEALKREACKRNSLRVLRVWRDWYLFSEDYLNGLQATFLMSPDPKWRGLCPDQLKVRFACATCFRVVLSQLRAQALEYHSPRAARLHAGLQNSFPPTCVHCFAM